MLLTDICSILFCNGLILALKIPSRLWRPSFLLKSFTNRYLIIIDRDSEGHLLIELPHISDYPVQFSLFLHLISLELHNFHGEIFQAGHLPRGNKVCKLYIGKKIILCQLHPLTFFHFKVFRHDWIQVAWTSVFPIRKRTRWKPGREGAMEQFCEFLTE